MEMLQLRYFVHVAEQGSFSRAAEVIHISQPALSGSIKRLEGELGFNLFDRSGRSIKLTDRGELFLRGTRLALDELDATVNAAASLIPRHTGLVSLGIFAPDYAIRTCIVDFAKLNPGVSFEINGRQVDHKSIRAEPYDLVFFDNGGTFEGFECTAVGVNRLGVVLPVGHRLARRESLALDELSGESFALLSDSDHDVETLVNAFCAAHPSSSVRFRCNTMLMLRQFVMEGLCLGLVREGYSDEFQANNGCTFALLEDAWNAPRIQLGARPEGDLSEAARAFKDFALSRLSNLADV